MAHRKADKNSCRLNPLLIPCEDIEKLNEITLAYYEHIRPANAAEASLVDLLIASIWRGARLVSYEAELLADKAEDIHPNLAASYQSISPNRLFALAFDAINGKGSANPMINRYLATTRNLYHSALSDIERLRKLKGDPEQPYYAPKLAKPVPAINLDFPAPESQPEPEPEPEPYLEPLSEPLAAPEPEVTHHPVVTPPQPPPSPEPEHPTPDLNSLLARAVPNPDAPYSPNTIWVHLLGSDGQTILDNHDRPILWPVYIGTTEPESKTSPEVKLKPMSHNSCNFSGMEIPDDLRDGN